MAKKKEQEAEKVEEKLEKVEEVKEIKEEKAEKQEEKKESKETKEVKDIAGITESGVPVSTAFKNIKQENQQVLIELGSGEYVFDCGAAGNK